MPHLAGVGISGSLDYVVGPRDLLSTTWYLNKVHFPVVVKTDGKDLRAKKKEERLGRLDSKIKRRENQIPRTCALLGRQSRRDVRREERWVSGPAGAIGRSGGGGQGHYDSYDEQEKRFTVPAEIREMAAEAAKCRDPVRRKSPRKRAREARREFDAGRAALHRSKVVHRPVVTKLWVEPARTETSGQKKSEPL